jgi:hypothetical protein
MGVGSVGIQRVYCYYGAEGSKEVGGTVAGIWLVWVVAIRGGLEISDGISPKGDFKGVGILWMGVEGSGIQ